jgi:hypothetical protein
MSESEIKTINFTNSQESDKDDFFSDGGKATDIIKLEEEESVSTEEDLLDDMSEGGRSSSSVDTVKLLSSDPLYLVLSKVLMNKDGLNLVEILEKINLNLEKIANKA